jgi:hypothetical protein
MNVISVSWISDYERDTKVMYRTIDWEFLWIIEHRSDALIKLKPVVTEFWVLIP